MANSIKIILAFLFFICLTDMPYGYYQLVRFAALIGFAILAYTANEQGQKTEAIVYICLAILFQPLIKIALGRELWNVVDVVVGVGLITSIFIKNGNQHKKTKASFITGTRPGEEELASQHKYRKIIRSIAIIFVADDQ
jgi:hypothetical protein